MIVISKHKDYYDYLAGVYGVDEKLVFDRRHEHFLQPIEPIENPRRVLIEPTEYVFAICGKIYYVYFFQGKCYHTLPELFELSKAIARWHKVPKVFPHISKWRPNGIEFITPPKYKWESDKPITEKEWLKTQYRSTSANKKQRSPVLVMPKLSSEWSSEVLLKDFGFASWIPANEMWINACTFMGWLVDNPPEPDNQTNKGKIVSHGFDTKRSFRPKMK